MIFKPHVYRITGWAIGLAVAIALNVFLSWNLGDLAWDGLRIIIIGIMAGLIFTMVGEHLALKFGCWLVERKLKAKQTPVTNLEKL